MKPKITVVVSSLNGAGRIEGTLNSLKKQTYGNLEVIVIDDGSNDGTWKIISRYPFRKLRNEKNMGLAFSRNRGIEEAMGEIVAFTDDDCLADRNWASELARAYEENSDVNAVGGRIEPFSTNTLLEKYTYYTKHPIYTHSTQFSSGGRIANYLRNLVSSNRNELVHKQKLSSLMGANSSYKRELLLKAGKYDPEFRAYGDDWELNIRLRKVGMNAIYCDRAIIHHRHRIEPKAFVRHMFRYGYVYPKIAKKHRELRFLPRPLPLLFFVSLPLSLFGAWFLPLIVPLIYYLKDMAYTLFRLKKPGLFLTLPAIDMIREFSYFFGSLWGLIK
jgi:glycosyltransferase involved in cell wall biosynthesis